MARSREMVELEYHCTRVLPALESLRAAATKGDADVVRAFGEVYRQYNRDLMSILEASTEAVDAVIAELERQFE